jgi:hypothetical protein
VTLKKNHLHHSEREVNKKQNCMKKIILPAILFATYFMVPVESEAKSTTSSKIDIKKVNKFAHCEIHDHIGNSYFDASGNCKRVMEMYEKWKRLNTK